MQAKLTVMLPAGPSAKSEDVVVEDRRRYLKLGTILDGPHVWMLVHGGFAESVDDECKERVAQCDPRQQGQHLKVVRRLQEEAAEFQQDIIEAAEESDDDDEECDEDDQS